MKSMEKFLSFFSLENLEKHFFGSVTMEKENCFPDLIF